MEFKIKQKALNEALSFTAGCVSGKNVIPVLANVLIESLGENAVQLTATDLDLTIRRTAEAEIITPGSTLVGARKLTDIVRSLPDGECRLETDKKSWTTMTHGRSRFRFAGTPRDTFPEIPTFKSTPIRVEASVLTELVGRVAFAVASPKSGTNYAVKDNIKLEIKDGLIRLIGIEGRCMAVADRPLESEHTIDVIVQKKTLIEAAKICTGTLGIGCDDNHVFIESDDQLLVSRLVAMQFPKWQTLMRKDADNIFSFDREAMRMAIRRAAVMADERNLSIRMDIKPLEVVVTSETRDEGDVIEIVDTDYKGEEKTFGFFYQYLSEFLTSADTKEPITFAFTDQSNTPCEMGIKGDGGYKFIIVPLNLEIKQKIDAAKVSKAA